MKRKKNKDESSNKGKKLLPKEVDNAPIPPFEVLGEKNIGMPVSQEEFERLQKKASQIEPDQKKKKPKN